MSTRIFRFVLVSGFFFSSFIQDEKQKSETHSCGFIRLDEWIGFVVVCCLLFAIAFIHSFAELWQMYERLQIFDIDQVIIERLFRKLKSFFREILQCGDLVRNSVKGGQGCNQSFFRDLKHLTSKNSANSKENGIFCDSISSRKSQQTTTNNGEKMSNKFSAKFRQFCVMEPKREGASLSNEKTKTARSIEYISLRL
uniref:Uncharacterized protein n=1 Tax=Glossina palpalis gambiensis TaxID=67801 RepID=A0A1B0ANH6_9MUSC